MTDSILSGYNIRARSLSELDGDISYSNIKYLVEDSEGKKYILKLFPDKEELEQAKEEQRILSLLRMGINFEVPEPVENKDGDIFTSYAGGEAVLLKYIEGKFLAETQQTASLIRNFGSSIAGLHLGLKDIDSRQVKAKKHFWDLQYAYLNYSKAEYIADPHTRKHIDYYFRRYHLEVLPRLHKLRHSLIHGDE